ncbi:FG-GAP-like repeat-containing protein [Pseudovibrio sp. POLY-S9]|uniref:FG-GAP-like repeat-containing protein n=1 Tax=Pseudovibrio sp. POLY-S9 TaxID=1576596 RepID=UPI00070DA082|nr:FG-GAP-like repeat-containing protein [Pseudovibrio sp. POLY-S9]
MGGFKDSKVGGIDGAGTVGGAIWTVQDEAIKQNWPGTTTFNVFGKLGASTFVAFEAMEVASGFAQDGVKGGAVQAAGAAWGWEAASRAIPSGVSLGANFGKVGGAAGQAVGGAIIGTAYGVVAGFGMETAVEALAPDAIDSNAYALLASTMAAKEILDVYAAHMSYTAKNIETYNPFTDYIYGTLATTIALSRAIKVFEDAYFPAPAPSSPFSDADAIENLREFVDNLDKSAETIKGVVSTGLGYQPGSQSSAQHSNNQVPSVPNLYDPLGSIYDLPKNPSFDNHTSYGGDGGSSYGDSDAGGGTASSGSDQNTSTAHENSSSSGASDYFGGGYTGEGYNGVGSGGYPSNSGNNSSGRNNEKSGRPEPNYGGSDGGDPHGRSDDHSSSYGDSDAGGGSSTSGSHSSPNDVGSVDRGTCFVAGTLILMSDGSAKPIEQVGLEDQVMAFDGLGELEPREVTDLFVHGKKPILDVDGVQVTSEHPFLLADGSYQPVGQLRVGDQIVRADGSLYTIERIAEVEGKHTVYNFTVEGLHTYVAAGFRVHNKFVDPVILDLDGNGIQVTRLDQSTMFMDAGGDGLEHRTAWAANGDGVLFYDPDGRDAITEKRQFVFTEWDPTATSDMEALASVFDSNGDGVLSAEDAAFAKFKLLVTNPDGSTSVKTLTELGITQINLTADASNIELSDGSVIAGQSTFTWSDGTTGTVGDMKLAASDMGYRVEQVESVDGAGARTLIATAYETDGSKAFEIHSVTSADGLVLTNRYDDNGDGVTNRIQSIVTVVGSDGSRTQTESNFAGSDMASAVLRSRTQTTTSADGNTLTIERDMTGGGWFEQREVRVTQSDGSQIITISALAKDGSVITSRSETVSSDGSVRVDGYDQDGDGSFDTNETHSVTVNDDDSRSETIAITNQDGSLRSHVKEDVSADGRTKVVERDLDGDGDTDTREELSITVAADGQTTSELTVKNGDGSLRSSTTTVQSADALTRTTTADQDGDGDIDLTIVDTTTIAADGSREQVVTQTNADGSVRSKTRETLGADKVSQQTFVDLNQNGSLEASEVVSSVVSSSTTQDRVATSWTRNADGSVSAKTVATTSADGLRTTTHTDRDGDGDTDVSVQDITSSDGGGNSTRTVTTRNSDGSLRSQAKVSTSADGLSVTTTTDVDGDGQIDARTVEVLAKETDGGTRQTRSDYAGDGSLISKQVVEESADRRVKTTSVDLDGDGNNDAVSIRTEQTDGSVNLNETSYANDGTALGQTLTTSSANGLTTSVARDLDGDLSVDVTVTSVTTLNADGSETTVQETRNADGSLRSQSTVSVSDDGLQSVTQTDDDGDGTFERSVQDTTVLKADGSTVRTSETRSDNGSLLSRTQVTLSDDELSSVVKTDADGDGTYDFVKTTEAELQADGSLVTTVELRDGSGELRTRSVETVSDNERYRSSEVDVNGDGQADQITTQTIAEDGQVTTSVRTQSKDGELQSQSVTLTSANGLSVTKQLDQDGDGVYERRNETIRSLNEDGSQTTTTSLKGQDGTLLRQTVLEVSDDTLVSTRRDDLNGDGQSDRTTNNQRVLAADGSQTTTSSITAQNGSLLSKTVSTMSADERSYTRSVDVDGNGHQDEVVSTVTGDDGVTTSTMAYYSESGGLLAKTVQSKSGNGLQTSTTLDLDGDGVTDRSISDVTVLSDDGSRTQTVTHMNGQGYAAARLETQTADDGLSGQVRLDRDGNGIFETSSSFETDFASNGDVTRTTTTTDTGGVLVAKTTGTTSGDGLHVSEVTDFDGDGAANRSVDRELGASGGGTETLMLSADDGQKLYRATTVTSADERSRTSTIDLDGDGVSDQKIETQLDLSGNQTTVHSQLREDGTAGTLVTQTTSANGHEQSYAFDLDGDGRADILRKTSISYDETGNQVKVFEEKDGDALKYYSTTVTSGNGLTSTTTVDSNGDGETDTTTVDETILGADGSTTFTSTERYQGGSLRSSYQEVTSADGRTLSKTFDFDGDGRKDKTEVTKTLADGSKTVTETAYSASGSAQKSFVTQTSSDGLTTAILREGITQTIARSVLNDGSYTWDNGVSASSSNEHIKVSHEIDAHGLETWRIEETVDGSTTVTSQRFDEAAKNRLLQEAAQIYDSVLDRKMDISEIEMLVQYADNSQLNHTALAQALLDSDEYTTRYGTLSDAGFIARTYQSTLGLEPELAELAEHLEDLNAGTLTRAQLSVDLARSVEHKVTGNNTGQTNNEDVFLFDLEKEEDLFASFGEEGPAIKTNDMEVKLGTDGADTLQIGSADAAFGGGGNDTITGGNGNDLLYGGNGNDILNGGKGIDNLVGGQGNDTLKGGDSTDVLTGGEGNDRLEGGSGNDVYAYKRGDGKDTISDSSGSADVLVLSDLTLDDVTLRRDGNDMIVYVLDKDNPDAALADLEGSTRIQNWNSSSKRIDTLRFSDGTEFAFGEFDENSIIAIGGNLTGSTSSDWLEGTHADEALIGDAGKDVLNGGAGDDTLKGGDDDDLLIAGAGNDRLIGGSGADYLDGGDGVDTAEYSSSGFGMWIDLNSKSASEIKYLNIFSDAQDWSGDVTHFFSSDQRWEVGDFNGDGKDDIFAVYKTGDSLEQRVYLSQGDSFSSVEYWTPDETWVFRDKWVTGDFNGDGKDDVLTMYAAGSDDDTKFRVYLSEDGGFSEPLDWSGDITWVYKSSQRWEVGDFNGDGKDDVFAVYKKGSGLKQRVYLSEGDGFASVENWTPNETWVFRDKWVTGDFNGDGKDDVLTMYAAGSDNDTKFRVYLSNGDGFSDAQDWSGDTTWVYKSSQRWETGDFNGDGKDDVFAVYADGSGVKQRVYLSEGDGFTSVENWTPDETSAFKDTWLTGDFTNDGKDDVVTIYGEGYYNLVKQTVYLTGVDPNIDSDTLVNIENIQGSAFDDVIRGNALDNRLWGNDGKDELNGRQGDDTLTGGSDSDTFVFDIRAFGHDEITDFATGAGSDDIISIDTELFADFTSVLAATNDVGGDTVIKLDDENSITLKGVSKTDLHVDDFQFI